MLYKNDYFFDMYRIFCRSYVMIHSHESACINYNQCTIPCRKLELLLLNPIHTSGRKYPGFTVLNLTPSLSYTQFLSLYLIPHHSLSSLSPHYSAFLFHIGINGYAWKYYYFRIGILLKHASFPFTYLCYLL